MIPGCRLCTANDQEALVEELAERIWESRRDREIDPEWARAGDYWHIAMSQFARATIDMLRINHG